MLGVSPGRSVTLNTKPKVFLFPVKPQTLKTGSRFSYENPSGSLLFFPVSVFLVGSHMGENLKTGFHPK
jgi:hypothetical protein